MTIVDALSTPHTSVSREVSRSISLRLAERVQASLVRCLTKLEPWPWPVGVRATEGLGRIDDHGGIGLTSKSRN